MHTLNAGDITVGDVAVNGAFGGPGITNYGTFMHNSGTIQIDRTATGIHNTNSFTNAATIIIGSISDITSGPGINNIGIFNNNTGGYISIDRVAITSTNTSAIWNSYGNNIIFNNNSVLKIGTLANIGNIGITVESGSIFNNLADGEITIERTANQGIYNNSTFNNAGDIDIGLTTSIGERGIMAAGTLFKNEGNISIDRASVHGIFASNGTFENSGTIDIGKTVGVGSWGFYTGFSSPIVNNLAGGEINIDNVTITGLRHDNGTFTNDGTLNLGSIASIGSWGLWNQATFNNNATGEIHVNRTTMTGMINNANTFTNLGEVYIGDLAAVGDHALYNALGATVRNEACALLSIFAPLNNLGTLVQEGFFKVNTLVAHTNTPGFTNNGVIEYFQGNPIPSVTNNDLVIDPFDSDTDPMGTILQIGGMNNFNAATTWYLDEALTMVAGTYNPMTNNFSQTGVPEGTTTLYFEVTDAVNNCTRVLALQYSRTCMPPTISDEPDAATVCAGEAVSFTVVASGSGMLSYQWQEDGMDIMNTGVYSNATTATLNISDATGLNGKQYKVIITDSDNPECPATSEEVTLTVNPIPTATVTAMSPICQGDDAVFTITATPNTSVYAKLNGFGPPAPPFSGDSLHIGPSGMVIITIPNAMVNQTLSLYQVANYAAIYFGTSCRVVNIDESATVVVGPKPDISASATSTTICNGETTTLNFTPTAGLTVVGWFLDDAPAGCNPMGSSLSTGTTYDVSPTTTTTYAVVIQNTGGCRDTACVTINLNPKPDITASATATTICPGESTTLNFTPTAGLSVVGWFLDDVAAGCNPTGDVLSTNTTYLVSPMATTTYAVVVQNTSGCRDTACVTINLNPKPDITAGATSTTICNGETTTLNFTPTAGLTVIGWFLDDVAAGCNPMGSSLSAGTTFDVSPTMTTSYAVVVQNSGGCRDTSCVTITVNDVDGGTIAADQTICSGDDPAAFTSVTDGSGSGTIMYRWASSTVGCNNANSFSLIPGATGATYDPPAGLIQTTYYRRITISTLNGVACRAVSNCLTVTVNQINPGEIAGTQTVCSTKDPAPFTSVMAATGSGTIMYQWESSTVNCDTGFAPIDGATAETFDPAQGQFPVTTYFRRRATSTLNDVACDAVSNCVILTVLNVDCGQFPWNGND